MPYFALFYDTVDDFASRRTPFRAAHLDLVRAAHARGESTELVVISWWISEEAIRGFAGDDFERAVVADEARRVLTSFDDTVRHYEVCGRSRLLVAGR